MELLHWRNGGSRFADIARHIPSGSSVLDVCSGPGSLFSKELLGRDVDYHALDWKADFVDYINRMAGSVPAGRVKATCADVSSPAPFPTADIVVMTGSLYHFNSGANAMISKMLAAATSRVILAEPVINLASSANPVVRRLAGWATSTPGGSGTFRFNEMTLNALLAPFRKNIISQEKIAKGREILTVLRGLNSAAGKG